MEVVDKTQEDIIDEAKGRKREKVVVTIIEQGRKMLERGERSQRVDRDFFESLIVLLEDSERGVRQLINEKIDARKAFAKLTGERDGLVKKLAEAHTQNDHAQDRIKYLESDRDGLELRILEVHEECAQIAEKNHYFGRRTGRAIREKAGFPVP